MSSRVEQVVISLARECAGESATSIESASDLAVRREIVGCILSSQVRHESAVAWTRAVEEAGLLEDRWWGPASSGRFRSRIAKLLAGRHRASKPLGRYRFFRTRASQLAAARDVFAVRSLRSFVGAPTTPSHTRRELISVVSGLGPKQASMLLRNLGVSYDLAVLDRYVLRFMEDVSLFVMPPGGTLTLRTYEQAEAKLAWYAERNSVRVGQLDWAIWATMKAAEELGL